MEEQVPRPTLNLPARTLLLMIASHLISHASHAGAGVGQILPHPACVIACCPAYVTQQLWSSWTRGVVELARKLGYYLHAKLYKLPGTGPRSSICRKGIVKTETNLKQLNIRRVSRAFLISLLRTRQTFQPPLLFQAPTYQASNSQSSRNKPHLTQSNNHNV
jgi:hypothetical protein